MGTLVSYLKGTPEAKAIDEKVAETSKPVVYKTTGEEVKDKVDQPTKTEPPFSAYEKLQGKPYSVDYFKVDNWEALVGEFDIDKTRDKVKFIEDYISNKIKDLKLEDSVASFKDLMERYKEELNIGKTEKNTSKLDRIYSYLKLMKKQNELDKRRRELIGNIQR